MIEFEILNLISQPKNPDPLVHLSVGDDCALVTIPDHHLLAMSTDTLVEGTHFLQNTTPFDVGFKSLAVNLSDLAAMGAEPKWYMTSLSVPNLDESWIKSFLQF